MANYKVVTSYTGAGNQLRHAKAWCIEEGAVYADNNFVKHATVPPGEDPDDRAEELGNALWADLEAAGHIIVAREDRGHVID